MYSIRRQLLRLLRRHPQIAVWLLLSPAILWCVVFTLIPLGLVVYYSLLQRGPWGTIIYSLTFDNYRQLLDPVFVSVVLRSLRFALLTAAGCLLAGYSVAYWIAFASSRYKTLLLLLVILPFWTSDLVRAYAWMALLADHGIINNTLVALQVIRTPLPLLHNEAAVLTGMIYTYLPFTILPLYAALERLDRRVLEAAADLGARPLESFCKITLPLTTGGILSATILVFVPALGEFVIPELLGGAKVMLLGKFIAMKFTGLRHWPLGATYALLLIVCLVGLLWVAMRSRGRGAFVQEPVL